MQAAATKPFGYMKFLPGPGLGGHCIPIDPHYLAWKMRGLNYKTRFIDLAGELNTEMPLFWVRKVAEALNGRGKAVRGAAVLVLGVAYKRDIDDIRESPALDIIRLLEGQGASVSYSDPHVPTFSEDGHQFHSIAAHARPGGRRRLRPHRHRPLGGGLPDDQAQGKAHRRYPERNPERGLTCT